MRPISDMIVSTAHHVRTVCFIVRPKNSLKSQNPGSFGGEKKRDPAPVAMTISSGLAPELMHTGNAMLPAVSAATVDEPQASRMTAATSQASSSADTFALAAISPM